MKKSPFWNYFIFQKINKYLRKFNIKKVPLREVLVPTAGAKPFLTGFVIGAILY